jgi:hypothetical protein
MTMTGSTAFVVEIQALQKLIAEKDAEIEQLKSWNQTLKQIVADDPEKHFYKVLLTRAADALESNRPEPEFPKLIDELRKAAQ